MNALILDDEPLPAKHLAGLIREHCFEVTAVTVMTEVVQAIQHLQDHHYDLLFLDVEMPEMNGFDFLERLTLSTTEIIFSTAHAQYAVEAFNVNAAHYILKPVMKEDLIKAVRKAAHTLNSVRSSSANHTVTAPPVPTLSLFDGQDYILVKEADIVRLEAEGSYTRVITTNHAPILTSKRLGHFEAQLNEKLFFRCHHSHLVNLRHILKVSKGKSGYITLPNQEQVPVSQSRKEQLHRLLRL